MHSRISSGRVGQLIVLWAAMMALILSLAACNMPYEPPPAAVSEEPAEPAEPPEPEAPAEPSEPAEPVVEHDADGDGKTDDAEEHMAGEMEDDAAPPDPPDWTQTFHVEGQYVVMGDPAAPVIIIDVSDFL